MNRPEHGWVLPRGSTRGADWLARVDDTTEGWQHTGLRIIEVHTARAASTWWQPGWECLVLPLAGSCRLQIQPPDGRATTVELTGRPGVFSGPTDSAYVPPGSRLTVSTDDHSALVALCLARAEGTGIDVQYLPADSVPVELRGAGNCSRQVHNFGLPGQVSAHRLIACEVLTPGGNWSSYPPHKHDDDRPGQESVLEEIYYFQTRAETTAPHPDPDRVPSAGHEGDAVAYHRVYGSSARPIDVLTEVRGGDIVLVPHGWHGPAMAPPGTDLYYLNVMAGPGPQREWLISDDPQHAWVRQSWAGQPIDPRLPMRGGQ